ncbi:hypothetical protein L226DRAFT_542753 [Lentinus tigrinus ALCF2SS1-7]|uniref:Uncharacterized protein n=1 Tax=Lentinus tigrinus ALCF2SS1-6 TaxID=1328759 RepID=A0A5C2SQG8_9APHY|nr:hypothetical protein L227DRAFT_582954 [Lentinus tigrinus ALCF2SS1-6]RPD80019.1 hypothetical protein L226DRAFT_542753 [Lentinus tigrinus ALCF2SS1-7]
MYGMDPRLTTLDSVDPSHPLLSSPSATSASTGASHASSPALTGVTPSFTTGPSSLASALDNNDAARSRSGSAASPANLTASGSELGFSSSGSRPSTTGHESGFQFPPPDFENSIESDEAMQDVPGGAHLMAIGDMLKNIARTANSGSEACSMGQSGDAREIVTVLKKNVLLVAELVAAMQLGDAAAGLSLNASLGPGPASSAATLNAGSVSAPVAAAMNVEQLQSSTHQQHTPPSLNGLPSGGSMDPNTMSDSSESRKRCASSVAGDRVVKSMKLEPQDEAPPMQVAPNMMPQTHFTYNPYPLSAVPQPLAPVGEILPIPAPLPSAPLPSSRPASSAGIPPSIPLGMFADAAQQVAAATQAAAIPVDPVPSMPHSPDFITPASATTAAMSAAAAAAGFMSSTVWPDNRVPVPRQHHHSLSAGAILNYEPAVPPPTVPIAGPSSMSYTTPMYSPTNATHLQQAPMNAASATLGRASRSHSVSGLHGNPFAHVPETVTHPTMYESTQSRPSTSGRHSPRAPSPDYGDDEGGRDSDDESGDQYNQYASLEQRMDGSYTESISSAEGPVNGTARSSAGQRRMSRTSPANEGGASGHGNEVPQEYRSDVERIFFEFLNSICSNLDATDSKGEPIHQTLMAKKMQRLDESPDFRPFKFRIQAFTNAFLEELARQGFPEEKIPMKKIRNFLWNQPYISRFNEEGKKSKSKGNHIWHVDGKKSEGGWTFRPFKRKLAGTPPGVAYVGLRWTWTPRIWDPQASRANMPVSYSSPSLPSWLSWKEDSLTGIPPPDAQSCDVTVEARFIQDGKEEVLTHTVHITIAPMAAVDSTFTPSRRPSLVGDIHNPRRIMSDSVVSSVPQPTNTQRILRGGLPAPAAPVVAPESQVVQVLTTAAQRVAQEAQSQVVASPSDAGPELRALAKQQHVLTVTAQAISSKLAGEVPEGAVAQSNALTVAAQQVVLQAARQVVADRTVAAVSSGYPPSVAASTVPAVTVKEVSVATQSAVAQAVDMVGPLSSEVDVLMTAKSLLQQQTRTPSVMGTIDPRSHSTGNSPPGPFDLSVAPITVPVPMAAVSVPPPGAVYYPPS